MLAQVGPQGSIEKFPSELSGGIVNESLYRGADSEPEFLLFDEPTTASTLSGERHPSAYPLSQRLLHFTAVIVTMKSLDLFSSNTCRLAVRRCDCGHRHTPRDPGVARPWYAGSLVDNEGPIGQLNRVMKKNSTLNWIVGCILSSGGGILVYISVSL